MTDVIKKYPELDELVPAIVCSVAIQCNEKTKNIKSEMPYKAQYVLEEVIKKLEELV